MADFITASSSMPSSGYELVIYLSLHMNFDLLKFSCCTSLPKEWGDFVGSCLLGQHVCFGTGVFSTLLCSLHASEHLTSCDKTAFLVSTCLAGT